MWLDYKATRHSLTVNACLDETNIWFSVPPIIAVHLSFWIHLKSL